VKQRSVFYGWIILGIAFVTMTLGYALRNTFSVFYPAIVEEFGWTRGNTAIMFSLTLLVYGFAAPAAGRLVDRFDPRVTLSAGACIAGGGIALCSLATRQWQFYLLYGVMVAIGLSMIGITPFSAIVTKWFLRRRGLVFGIMNAGFSISLLAAPFVQSLISNLGWQAAYAIIGLLSIAVLLPLCALFILRTPQEKGLQPDGMPQAPTDSASQPIPPRTPGQDTAWTLPRALKTHQFWLLFLTNFLLMGMAEQIAITHQVYFYRDAGYQPMMAATIYSVCGQAFMAGNLCSFISDRLGREKVFIPSCLLSAGAVALLFLMNDSSALWMPFLFAVCFGFGFGVAVTVFFATVADLYHGKHFGSIQGFVVLGFSLGGAISPWLAGFLHDRTGSYFTTFVLIVGALVACAVLMHMVAPGRLRSPDSPARS